ncbi:hypothetical protein D0T84_00780 [Dysgonomonas sp. 521]|uniref:hypothetical protein n=1 Tax=Dysgonomonas sp. 521 TaxID=2302932 RepID=UPI0013D55AED|nr:hypothetical protein [Dysgonomonas sp. 521]NDV93452.1 hypothetical protein [Dysgonomonas sp. 521]
MQLTLDKLFNDPNIVKAIIDRVMQTRLDTIYWKRYLDFEQTMSRTFKTYLGTVTGVTAGSIIDRNSNKPLRERRALGQGYGEVAYLGDRYQMDNDRLDQLKSLIDKYNQAKTADQIDAMNAIIDYITDDLRQVLLAPHKRMDIVVGSLRSTGKAEVKLADNPQGIELLDIELPMKFITPEVGEQAKFISFLKELIESLRATIGAFSVIEMSRSTFNKYIIGASEFGTNYKMIFGSAELAQSGGLMTDAMANQLFTGIGLPPVRIVEEYVAKTDGTTVSTFADKRITLLQADKIGKMMWHEPYEASDPVPGKTYTRSEGGMYISQVRTDEGRFMEYGAEWIPNIAAPHKMVNIDLANFS